MSKRLSSVELIIRLITFLQSHKEFKFAIANLAIRNDQTFAKTLGLQQNNSTIIFNYIRNNLFYFIILFSLTIFKILTFNTKLQNPIEFQICAVKYRRCFIINIEMYTKQNDYIEYKTPSGFVLLYKQVYKQPSAISIHLLTRFGFILSLVKKIIK